MYQNIQPEAKSTHGIQTRQYYVFFLFMISACKLSWGADNAVADDVYFGWSH